MAAQTLAESFPFDGAPLYADQYRALADQELLSGVLRNEDNKLAVSTSTGMSLSVATGKVWIDGVYAENATAKSVTLDTPDESLARIDRVVLVADHTARTIAFDKVTGTPAVSPVAPALTQDGERYEMPLALVAVGAGAGGLVAGDITDDRRWAVPAHGEGGLIAALSVAADATITNSGLEQIWPGWSLQAVLRADRRYRFQAGWFENTAGPGSTPIARIRDGGLTGTQICRTMHEGSTVAGAFVRLHTIKDDLAEGLHTFVLTTANVAIATTLYGATTAAVANAISPVPWFTIADVGPA